MEFASASSIITDGAVPEACENYFVFDERIDPVDFLFSASDIVESWDANDFVLKLPIFSFAAEIAFIILNLVFFFFVCVTWSVS